MPPKIKKTLKSAVAKRQNVVPASTYDKVLLMLDKKIQQLDWETNGPRQRLVNNTDGKQRWRKKHYGRECQQRRCVSPSRKRVNSKKCPGKSILRKTDQYGCPIYGSPPRSECYYSDSSPCKAYGYGGSVGPQMVSCDWQVPPPCKSAPNVKTSENRVRFNPDVCCSKPRTSKIHKEFSKSAKCLIQRCPPKDCKPHKKGQNSSPQHYSPAHNCEPVCSGRRDMSCNKSPASTDDWNTVGSMTANILSKYGPKKPGSFDAKCLQQPDRWQSGDGARKTVQDIYKTFNANYNVSNSPNRNSWQNKTMNYDTPKYNSPLSVHNRPDGEKLDMEKLDMLIKKPANVTPLQSLLNKYKPDLSTRSLHTSLDACFPGSSKYYKSRALNGCNKTWRDSVNGLTTSVSSAAKPCRSPAKEWTLPQQGQNYQNYSMNFLSDGSASNLSKSTFLVNKPKSVNNSNIITTRGSGGQTGVVSSFPLSSSLSDSTCVDKFMSSVDLNITGKPDESKTATTSVGSTFSDNETCRSSYRDIFDKVCNVDRKSAWEPHNKVVKDVYRSGANLSESPSEKDRKKSEPFKESPTENNRMKFDLLKYNNTEKISGYLDDDKYKMADIMSGEMSRLHNIEYMIGRATQGLTPSG